MPDETALHPHVTLDMRGLHCPAPLLAAKRLVDDLEPGQTLELLSDCPGTQADLFAWARHTGNGVRQGGRRTDGVHAYLIKRGRVGRPRANAVLDVRGAVCPGPIVEAKRLLDAMGGGEVLKLVSNCPGVHGDVAGWVRATGLALLAEEEVAPGEFEFYLSRG
jgi:tRNA 2-thiouridine synthesizing protein A